MASRAPVADRDPRQPDAHDRVTEEATAVDHRYHTESVPSDSYGSEPECNSRSLKRAKHVDAADIHGDETSSASDNTLASCMGVINLQGSYVKVRAPASSGSSQVGQVELQGRKGAGSNKRKRVTAAASATPPSATNQPVPSSTPSSAPTDAAHTVFTSETEVSTTSTHGRPPNGYFDWKNNPENQKLIRTELSNQGRPTGDYQQVAAELWYCYTNGTAVTRHKLTELEMYRRKLMFEHGLRGQELTEAVRRKYEDYDPKQTMARGIVLRTCFPFFGV
jgi:FAD/FMN-containing dehydrogenase